MCMLLWLVFSKALKCRAQYKSIQLTRSGSAIWPCLAVAKLFMDARQDPRKDQDPDRLVSAWIHTYKYYGTADNSPRIGLGQSGAAQRLVDGSAQLYETLTLPSSSGRGDSQCQHHQLPKCGWWWVVRVTAT